MDQQTVLFIIALLSAVGGLWFRIDAAIRASADKIDKRIDASNAQGLLLQSQLSEFKLTVSENYVRSDTAERTEERLIASIDKLAAQMDKVINRFDALSLQLTRHEEERATRARAPPDTMG